MKKITLLVFTFLVSNICFSQLTLEREIAFDSNEFNNGVAYLPDYGYVYYTYQSKGIYDEVNHIYTKTLDKITIYDYEYNVIKEIDLIGANINCYFKDICNSKDISDKRFNLTLSQYIFNENSKIEFTCEGDGTIFIYDEDLSLVQEIPIAQDEYSVQMIDISLNNNTEYKLFINFGSNVLIYGINRNPFVAQNPTEISSLGELNVDFNVSKMSSHKFKAIFSPSLKGYIFISNSNGQIVNQIRLTGTQEEVNIDLSSYSSGIYLVNLYSKVGYSKTVKVINN